jgi:hypothetical protein
LTRQVENPGALASAPRHALVPIDPITLAAPRGMPPFSDARHATVRLPGTRPGRDTVVRPALAVLYRIALGANADRYVRRFLAFERTGRGRVGWHWTSFLAPAVWAFYRKLWIPGVLFALLPLAGALAFGCIEPRLPHADATWIASAVLLVWVFPGVVPALIAETLLYRHVRADVRRAERAARSATGAARELSAREPTSALAALLFGGGATLIAIWALFPPLAATYAALDVRERLSDTLAAVRGLEEDIESTWASARLVPQQTHHPAVQAKAQAAALEDVDVNPLTGRVRLALGPALRQLWGKTILLFPSRDDRGEVRWICVPIDIPARYLPAECRH